MCLQLLVARLGLPMIPIAGEGWSVCPSLLLAAYIVSFNICILYHQLYYTTYGFIINATGIYCILYRFLQSYGVHINHIELSAYTSILNKIMLERNITDENLLTTYDLQQIVEAFKVVSVVPQDPYQQLYCAIESIYNSWDSPSVNMYREVYGIPWVSAVYSICSI